jgi:hypothetical protein
MQAYLSKIGFTIALQPVPRFSSGPFSGIFLVTLQYQTMTPPEAKRHAFLTCWQTATTAAGVAYKPQWRLQKPLDENRDNLHIEQQVARGGSGGYDNGISMRPAVISSFVLYMRQL